MTERRLSLGGRPAPAPIVSPNDVLRALMSLKIGDQYKTDIGDVVRTADDEFKLVVRPDHFRGALDALMGGGL